MSKTRLLIILGILLLFIGGWLVYQKVRHDQTHTALLTVEAAPADSKITIGGKRAKNGLNALVPGEYVISVTHKGFAEQTKKVTVSKGVNDYQGFVLVPNSDTTANWYPAHPEDQRLVEGISSKTFDSSSKKREADFPLIKELPFIDNFFRVDYGKSERTPNDPSATAVYITLYNQAAKQDALDWIKSTGNDPDKLEIIYRQP